jgi:hypothetical protein
MKPKFTITVDEISYSTLVKAAKALIQDEEENGTRDGLRHAQMLLNRLESSPQKAMSQLRPTHTESATLH